MPPKSRGRGRPRAGGRGRGRPRKAISQPSSEESDSSDEASDNSSSMSGDGGQKKGSRKGPAMLPRFPRPTGPAAGTPITRASSTRRTRNAIADREAIPEMLREMVEEAVEPSPERPLKKRRIRGRGTSTENSEKATSSQPRDDDSSIQFEDVSTPQAAQTFFRESDDESDENDITWEEIDVDQTDTATALPSSGPSTSNLRDLDLNLSINTKVPQETRNSVRRKPITKEEANTRISIHKMHILCLLAHVEIRNRWCNDSQVHDALRPLFTASMTKFLKPAEGSDAEKMDRMDSLRAGLNFAGNMWRSKFQITARGMRRGLWADREEDLGNYSLPDDIDNVHDLDDFRAAAKELKGSRDVGAQLYCALLRCLGLDVRLVCSLQPLSIKRFPNEPPMPAKSASKKRAATAEPEEASPIEAAKNSSSSRGNISSTAEVMPVTPARRRLGNQSTAGWSDPTMTTPPPRYSSQTNKRHPISESSYPIYWVEVLSDGPTVQWIPVDPLVLKKIDKRRDFEPPAIDKENSMRYVIAFEDDGRAREVTRRYTKAFNSKTRKMRVESTEGGKRWWNRTLEHFSRGFVSGVDDVEDLEFARYEAQEPMPNNAADFKNHTVYALEQHIKRNEVIIGKEIGKFAAGYVSEGGQGSGRRTKKLVGVYRRSDVKIAKSADGWYRVGREVKEGEQPVKTVPARRRADDNMEDDAGDGVQDRAGVGLYTEDQTRLYESPPVVNGRVPANSYGNLDIYVPSMIPKGGVHIPEPEAKLAARIIGVHSVDAVTGFEFRGRHGTAVVKGVVVAAEFQEAIEAVIQGLRDQQQDDEDEKRSQRALRMWKRFMMGLRVKERIATYKIEGEEDEDEDVQPEDAAIEDSGMESEEYVSDGGGGFFPE